MIKGPTVDHEGAGRGEKGAGKWFSLFSFSNSLASCHPWVAISMSPLLSQQGRIDLEIKDEQLDLGARRVMS
jgi:hypothetical protein